jgi:hypothetical protein
LPSHRRGPYQEPKQSLRHILARCGAGALSPLSLVLSLVALTGHSVGAIVDLFYLSLVHIRVLTLKLSAGGLLAALSHGGVEGEWSQADEPLG